MLDSIKPEYKEAFIAGSKIGLRRGAKIGAVIGLIGAVASGITLGAFAGFLSNIDEQKGFWNTFTLSTGVAGYVTVKSLPSVLLFTAGCAGTGAASYGSFRVITRILSK